MSYKVNIQAMNETSWHSNGLRFATREEAESSGESLWTRWSAVDKYEVVESNEPVNYKFENGADVPLED